MKRLLIDVNSVVPFFITGKTTGIGRTTYHLISELAKVSQNLSFELILFSQNMKGIGGKQFCSPFKSIHFYLPYRRFVTRHFNNIPVKEAFIRYDLMHVPHNFEYVYKPEKTIFTLHDALFMKTNEKMFDHLELRKKVPSLMKKCKGIITCSESSKTDIVETMSVEPSKIDVIYWGVDHGTFYRIEDRNSVRMNISAKLNINRPYFISVSCSDGRKNTHKLVEAYVKLHKNNLTNDLVLLWNNPPVFVLQMINNAGLGSRVHFFSNVSDKELMLLYNGATAMIFPSSYEGFGLPVLEAMACGTPVVTCRNSSLPEVGGEAALYMDEPSVENIYHYLEKFETSQVQFEELSQKCLVQAGKFRWDKTADQYIKVYGNHLRSI